MSKTQQNCPICGVVTSLLYSRGDSLVVDCPRCGRFEISGTALHMFQKNTEKDKVISVSFWIRSNQPSTKGNFVCIDTKTLREILKPFVPLKPMEQVNRALLWFGDNIDSISGFVRVPISHLVPIMGCKYPNDVDVIMDHLFRKGLTYSEYDTEPKMLDPYKKVGLTFQGWEKFYELQSKNVDSRLAFMAMKYDQEPLETLFDDVIKKAVDETGFEIRKLTEEKRAGLIDDKLRVEIRRSKFLIADLTHDNNGAYWEAGFAEGLGMPVIYICEKKKFNSQKSHFDTNHHLTVQWEEDPKTWGIFAEELKATIRATFPAEAKMN